METTSGETPSERLRQVFELFELAEEMVRQNLRRKRPEVTEAELDAAVDEWLLTRRGAEHGDGEGTPGRWPRR